MPKPKSKSRVIPTVTPLSPRHARIAWEMANKIPLSRKKKGLLNELVKEARQLPGTLGGTIRNDIARSAFNMWNGLKNGDAVPEVPDVPPDPVPPPAPAVDQVLETAPAVDPPPAGPLQPGPAQFNLAPPQPNRPCRVGPGQPGQRWGLQPFRW